MTDSLVYVARRGQSGSLDPAQDICVILSETGLETEAPPPDRTAVAFDEASLRRLVTERLGGR